MKEWANRPPEIAALLNPAFCGFLMSTGLDAYTQNVNEGAPYAFPFVMLPLVLHKPTRQAFPRSSRTAFSNLDHQCRYRNSQSRLCRTRKEHGSLRQGSTGLCHAAQQYLCHGVRAAQDLESSSEVISQCDPGGQ